MTVDYDHHSREYSASSVEMNAELRARCPVAWSESYGGFWVLSRYEDVARASRDDAAFSSHHDLDGTTNGYQGIAIPAPPVRMIPLEVDPPEFHVYRRLLNPRFSPAAVDAWTSFITDCVSACLDSRIERGAIDLVLDLANPVPAIVTLAILGLPLADWAKYAEPMHTIVFSPPGSEDYNRAAGDQLWIVEQLVEAVRQRKADPQADLLSELAHASMPNGDGLAEDDAVAIAYTVLAGGVDTTTALLANALVWLSRHPDGRDRLRADAGMLPLAREEFLRYFAPVQGFARTVTADVEVHGQLLRAGERVLLSWASANRDEIAFERPDDVVLDRAPNRHASFGLGAHRCLGSNFARHEIDIVLHEVLARLPDYAIAEDAVERYESIGNINGYVRVPARFAPGPRRGSPLATLIEGES